MVHVYIHGLGDCGRPHNLRATILQRLQCATTKYRSGLSKSIWTSYCLSSKSPEWPLLRNRSVIPPFSLAKRAIHDLSILFLRLVILSSLNIHVLLLLLVLILLLRTLLSLSFPFSLISIPDWWGGRGLLLPRVVLSTLPLSKRQQKK